MDKIRNLKNKDAVSKLQEMINDIRVCMFFTQDGLQKEQGSPMSAADVDDRGTIWFLSNKNASKIKTIETDHEVHLVFSHPGKEMYLDIYGDAIISTDKNKIAQCWTPLAKAWFPGGKDDPNICLIKVSCTKGNYWDTRHGKMIEFLKIISSAITGEKMGDGESGEIAVMP